MYCRDEGLFGMVEYLVSSIRSIRMKLSLESCSFVFDRVWTVTIQDY